MSQQTPEGFRKNGLLSSVPRSLKQTIVSYRERYDCLGLFKKCDTDEIKYFIDETSSENANSDSIFEMIGVILAKGLFDKIPLNLCLNKHIWKFLVANTEDTEFEDLKELD